MIELQELALLLESDRRNHYAVICEWFRSDSGTSTRADQDTTQHLSNTTSKGATDPLSFWQPLAQVFRGSNARAGTSLVTPAISLSMGQVTMLAFPNTNSIGISQATPEFRAQLPAPAAGSGSVHAPPESKIVDLVIARRSAAEVEPENAGVADAAASDAVKLIERAKLNVVPKVTFSDDGLLSLQWQRGDRGVVLVLCGDGTVSIGFRRPGQYYAENGIELLVTDDLPPNYMEDLAAITT
jgi:hypothetical protein